MRQNSHLSYAQPPIKPALSSKSREATTPVLSEYASTAWDQNLLNHQHNRSKSLKRNSSSLENEPVIREATIELDENIEDTSQTNNSEGDEYLAQQHDRTFGKLSAPNEKGHKRSNSRFNQVHNFDFRYLSQDEKPRDAVLLHKR